MNDWESQMLDKVNWIRDQRTRHGLSATWLVTTLKHKGCDCSPYKIQEVLNGNVSGNQLDVEIILHCALIVLNTYAQWLET